MSSTKVVTGVVRGSFLNLFAPRAQNPNQDPKFSMVLLIPKGDVETMAKLRAAQKAAVEAKWPQNRPPKLEQTIHDGDGVRPSTGEPFGAECKGHWVMSCSSKDRPGLVDRNRNEVVDKTAVVSGDYFKVSVNAFGYDQSGKRGVSFGLNNVLIWEKGEPLTARGRATDDFASEFDGSGNGSGGASDSDEDDIFK